MQGYWFRAGLGGQGLRDPIKDGKNQKVLKALP